LAVVITGIPEFPILIQSNDVISIDEFGIWEFFLRDENIASREEALNRASAELEASKNEIISGSFSTYTEGFSSGQAVSIQNTPLGIDDDFIIEKVRAKLLTPKDQGGDAVFQYDVEFASNRMIGIVDFLQDRLFEEELLVNNTDRLLSFLSVSDTMGATDSISAPVTTSPPYLIGSFRVGFGTVN
jgi:hypothetical protein